MTLISLFLLLGLFGTGHTQIYKYEPTWESLDARPLPDWYDDAKIGIFIHWGVFSVPSYGSEWFWRFWREDHSDNYVDFMNKNYPPGFTYQNFAREFTAEFFNPEEWADVFSKSGAKYVVLTSKHHEGYTLWPSQYSYSWNVMDVGPQRDLVGDLGRAVREKTDLRFGLYHSLYEWFHPLYLSDRASGYNEDKFVQMKTLPELYEIVNNYHPDVVWSDGEWEASDEYWKSKEFLAWLYNESPVKDTVVVNDRWGTDTSCHHGGFFACQDRYSPGVLQSHKWENAMTIDKGSWGYRREASASSYMSTHELITEIVKTVSCRGNILINIGPTKDGKISPIFEERLLDIGQWLQVNGEAIYFSKPWLWQNDTETEGIWYTARPDLNATYATFLEWPQDSTLNLWYNSSLITDHTKVTMLGVDDIEVKWSTTGERVSLSLPNKALAKTAWAWVLKFIN